jgi:hypothetical protein
MPQLVLLWAEPLVPTVQFVQGAVQHVMGLSLPMDDSHATEFVTGEFPIFFVQYSKRLLQLKFFETQYFDPMCRPFITYDPDSLQRKIQSPELREAIAEHQAWVGVACMNWWDKRAGNGDAYGDVGKMLSAFTHSDVRAVIWPNQAQIRLWDYEMSTVLFKGDPLQIFRGSEIDLGKPTDTASSG